jgi:hypothetical protein
LRGLGAAGLSPPFGGGRRAGVEYDLYLFLCLLVWACCIGRWDLGDPSFDHLAVGVKAPIRIRDLVFLGLLRLIFLIQGVSTLIDPNVMMGLIYILAGAAK